MLTFSLYGGITGARSNQALTDWMKSEGIKDDYLNSISWVEYDMAQATQEQFDRMALPISEFFRRHTQAELFNGAIERKIMLYPVYSTKEVVEDPQLKDRGFWQELSHSELDDTITYPGAFVKFSETAHGLRRRAPLIGEHNQEVYTELGLSTEDLLILGQNGVI